MVSCKGQMERLTRTWLSSWKKIEQVMKKTNSIIEEVSYKITKLLEQVLTANLHKEGIRQKKLLLISIVRNVLGAPVATRLLDEVKDIEEDTLSEPGGLVCNTIDISSGNRGPSSSQLNASGYSDKKLRGRGIKSSQKQKK